jgi:hypothetical protein
LVVEHLSPVHTVAAGLRAIPNTAKAFASTQAAWRFFNNSRIVLPHLMRPLILRGAEGAARDCFRFVLVMHDWSYLHYPEHTSKKDRIPLGNTKDLGYELQSALLVSDRDGQPLAPVSMSLKAADGVHCSRSWTVREPRSKLDELQPVMDFVARSRLAKPAVHISDAESDSVAHYRSWSAAAHLYLVRADDRLAQHEGQMRRFSEICDLLWQRGAFHRAREVTCKGKRGVQWVAETTITLTRPATPQRRDGQPRRKIAGPPLTLRLVISRIRSLNGENLDGQPTKDLAIWFLLTNVPAEVEAAEIALWYYWRWDIESYFKLVKSAGHQLEHWQQETAEAVARRLLVASMACVVVWQLGRETKPEAVEFRDLLIRLSGRQMRKGKTFSAPAMLAGLWVLISMLSLLDDHDLDHLRRLTQMALGDARAGPVQC